MCLATSDIINICIAIGTGVAAIASCIAAYCSYSSAKRNERFAQKIALEEKDRWLTDMLFSLANQCNQCVSETGELTPTEGNLSRMITIICNAIKLIERMKHKDNRKPHLQNFWIFLHSSIWVELESQEAFYSVETQNPPIMSTINAQYIKVKSDLVKVVR